MGPRATHAYTLGESNAPKVGATLMLEWIKMIGGKISKTVFRITTVALLLMGVAVFAVELWPRPTPEKLVNESDLYLYGARLIRGIGASPTVNPDDIDLLDRLLARLYKKSGEFYVDTIAPFPRDQHSVLAGMYWEMAEAIARNDTPSRVVLSGLLKKYCPREFDGGRLWQAYKRILEEHGLNALLQESKKERERE